MRDDRNVGTEGKGRSAHRLSVLEIHYKVSTSDTSEAWLDGMDKSAHNSWSAGEVVEGCGGSGSCGTRHLCLSCKQSMMTTIANSGYPAL